MTVAMCMYSEECVISNKKKRRKSIIKEKIDVYMYEYKYNYLSLYIYICTCEI